MRTLSWLGAVGAAILLLCSAASAAPSHLGPTGIVATPTADVVGARQYDVAVDYVKWDTPAGHVKCWPTRLLAGVSDKVEAGVGYVRWEDSTFSMKVVPINVKAVVVPEDETSPAVALGAAYGRYKAIGEVKVTTLYAVATKTLSEAEAKGTIHGSLGLMYNRYKDSDSDSATKPFVSLEYTTAGGATTVAVEYKPKEDVGFLGSLARDAVSSLVVRHMVTPDAWAETGLTNAWHTFCNPVDGDHEWFIGVGYRWVSEPEEWYY